MWLWCPSLSVLAIPHGPSVMQQDLGSSDGPPRNWKGIGIAMVVILAVMSLVILSVILLTPDESHLLLRSHLTMEDLESEEFKVHDPSVAWLNGMDLCYLLIAVLIIIIPSLCNLSHYVLIYVGFMSFKWVCVAQHGKPLRLTSTDQEQNVVNGLSDWTYEEEVLLTYVAHWWSVDGARLAYLTLNNSATPVMEIPHFLGGLYPSNVLFPYPKAGSSIPSVSLFVVNLYGPAHTLEMMPPDSLRARDSYISMVTWISSTRLAVRWLNRAQNQSVLCVCEATTGACSEVSGHRLYHISNPPATPSVPPRFLTSGNWDVTSLCALDEKAGKMYVRGTVVDLDGVFQRQCISCNLLDGCRYFKAEFSPGIPKVTVHSTKDPYRYVVLEDNSPLSKALEDKSLPETLFRIISADNQGTIKKPDTVFLVTCCATCHAPQGKQLTPNILILFVLSFRDSAPGSQSVTEEFTLGWPQVLCSAHNVALAWVDGRSGVVRGQKTTAVDPRKLGSLRVKDHLGVVESVQLHNAFGGYLTLKMLAATDKLFQCAATVAPITDFRLYSDQLCCTGVYFQTASLLGEVNKLKDENFLIVHGTADGKTLVHFQHSAELLSRLVKVEANYSLQLYPDEGHTLREPRSILHFQRTVVNYLQNCLKHSTYLDVVEEEEEEDD
uniref:Dipeptidyl-peptidase 6b n=1 Tax=Sphaeramia orbicularis TaxID=375764 RepID=A0A673CQR1_9TELE